MKFTAILVQTLLWLSIAVSPALVGGIVGFFLSLYLGSLDSIALPICLGLGFVTGAAWAERIRKTIGLSAFLGKLMGNPEIDGRN
ncbi:hypothetical protein RGQ13_01565 [Thalassotalea psychrophila]|uniref:Uncharacterized protein n=1 Tax=Thalassotalea psychrophila TaxID=3065647 RepID=A0ABY9TYZ3_9GAMM|nr:hypothetical protein RGQ13_01565 [Colwelliaceae bacterium SQ149]